jgi:hypothetical protein
MRGSGNKIAAAEMTAAYAVEEIYRREFLVCFGRNRLCVAARHEG